MHIVFPQERHAVVRILRPRLEFDIDAFASLVKEINDNAAGARQ